MMSTEIQVARQGAFIEGDMISEGTGLVFCHLEYLKNAALLKDWVPMCREIWDFGEFLYDLSMSHDLQWSIEP